MSKMPKYYNNKYNEKSKMASLYNKISNTLFYFFK